ncbi:NADH-quinone oxidoreductase subunit C [Geoalkalibacter halelectricus]|uniref:NADH-quinone oxidoreductase subunit C n=1 Tax=Geoalkalibacter halelectricus TaxID=2847045 RepID=A0ABY5ZMX0_9BACT|nr:NADH-quinone oxidoreductase subunit C [Geoalkalibacter halelectricus]MDO3378292.1 NADH-quinone oxidoreductase subunit C [Geoalkalibacter halelectricus]UWZ79297.1 NADH-quinone oxidoreductase subunit C [Geoalkalibacter halelectricus]
MSALTLKNGGLVPLAELEILDFAAFAAALRQEVDAQGRIAALFAAPAGEQFDLFALVARDRQGQLAVLRSRVGTRFASLTPELPQVHLFEREIAEQYGLVPEGHPWFKPLRFHPSWTGRDAWGRDPRRHPLVGEMDYYRVAGEEVHEVAVGPVHAGIIEPGHFRFQCHGEQVLHLEISLGYQHRAVEALLPGTPAAKIAHQMETLAGDSTIAHASAYAQICEALAGTPAPPRALAIRALALELERLANHVGDIGGLATDVGFLPTASFCGRIRGDYLNLSAELCGSRFGRGLVRPGGTAFDLDASLAARMLERLEAVARDTRGALEIFFDSPSVLARLEGTGRVAAQDAAALGLVGVAARACGLNIDARRHHPWGAYLDRFDHLVTEDSGDVFARARVRRREINDSLRWVRDALRDLPAGPSRLSLPARAARHLAVALVEGWRGEVVHLALTDQDGRFSRYKIVDPSFRNWSGLAMALRGEQISDFPLCNKSFNLSYCGFDL